MEAVVETNIQQTANREISARSTGKCLLEYVRQNQCLEGEWDAYIEA